MIYRWLRALVTGGAVWLLSILLATPSQAQETADPNAAPTAPKKKPPPVNMVVHVGHEKQARKQAVTPVRVVLDNNDKAVTGYLEVRRGGDITQMPVDLPRQAHKEYTLFLKLEPDEQHPQMASGELVLYADRRVLARETLMPTYSEDGQLVISATADGSGLQFMSEERKRHVAHYSPQDLPRQWPGYEPADVVALNGRAWGEMDEEQRRAFRIWVEQGGRAILCGESTTEWRDPDGQALAGVNPRDVASLSRLQSVAAWGDQPYRARAGGLLTVSGPLAPGSRPLFMENGRPLIVEREALRGRVVWLGFDAFRGTLRDWEGFNAFWRGAVDAARRSTGPEPVHPLADVDEAREAVSALPRLPVPPIGAIIGFGVVYALIFGPVNIWMLRRLRRTVKSWLFTPSLAIVMTLVALVVGQQWGAARAVLNSLSVLQTTSGSRTACEQNLIGLFSPTNRVFDLAVMDAAPELEDLGGADPQEQPMNQLLGWPDHQEDGEVKWDAVPLQLFSTRLLRMQRPADLGGAVDIQLKDRLIRGDLQPAGAVRNGTYLTLRRAYLTLGGRYCWLGDLPPGGQALVASGSWKPKLAAPKEAAAPVGALQENRMFQEGAQRVHLDARNLLIPQYARDGLWLVAECTDYRGGLAVADLPYSNRAGLLLVQVLSGKRRG